MSPTLSEPAPPRLHDTLLISSAPPKAPEPTGVPVVAAEEQPFAPVASSGSVEPKTSDAVLISSVVGVDEPAPATSAKAPMAADAAVDAPLAEVAVKADALVVPAVVAAATEAAALEDVKMDAAGKPLSVALLCELFVCVVPAHPGCQFTHVSVY